MLTTWNQSVRWTIWTGLLCVAMTSAAWSEESIQPAGTDRLVIHEWGTFTSLQNESGAAIAGINTDDEAVPEFVHRFGNLIPQPSELAPVFYKGVPRSHRQVKMRLETPVIYFHPPAGAKLPLTANVQVDFHGGWLTEYFPDAKIVSPNIHAPNFRFQGLTPQSVGSLAWENLQIGTEGKLPDTEAAVWLTPRAVDAAVVQTPQGEAEKYIFYRGVGAVPSPLTVIQTPDRDALMIQENLPANFKSPEKLRIRAMWLVHVLGDGRVAFRTLGAATLTGVPAQELARAALGKLQRIAETDEAGAAAEIEDVSLGNYSPDNLTLLRSAMREKLIEDGLYADEAEAMLKTWELAYFKSPGFRLFYVVPQPWTNAVMPLKCSLAAKISRTMVGRIELVTPRQRRLISRLGQTRVTTADWYYRFLENHPDRLQAFGQLWEGKVRFQDLNVAVPQDYQFYIDLGRFRHALLLDEVTRRPDSEIRKFVRAYNIEYFGEDD
jgi:hypothetical protein